MSMPPEFPERLAYLVPVMAEVRRFKYRLRWWLFGYEDPAARRGSAALTTSRNSSERPEPLIGGR